MHILKITIILIVFIGSINAAYASDLIIYKTVYLEKNETNLTYTDIVSVYKYHDYAEETKGLFIVNNNKFIIKKSDIISAMVEDVWFKPEDLLIYQVAIKINDKKMQELISFLENIDKIAFIVDNEVFTLADVSKPLDFKDDTFVISVAGRNKIEIKDELNKITVNVILK